MIMFVFYVSKCTSPSGPSITSSLLELGQKCGLRDVCKIMKRSTVGYINYSEQQDWHFLLIFYVDCLETY